MSDGSAGNGDARAVDAAALGVAMSGMKRGFSAFAPVHFSPAPEPKHFRPANPGTNPTEGWDPFDPLGEKAGVATDVFDPVEAARAAAFAEGMAAAERMAADRGEADAQALGQLVGLLEMMSAFDRDALASRLRQTVLFLVTRLVGEVGVSSDLLTQRIEAAVGLLSDHSEMAQLRLNPADLVMVDGHQPARVTLIADEAIGRGGFRIETRATSVEDSPTAWLAQLSAALDRAALPDA